MRKFILFISLVYNIFAQSDTIELFKPDTIIREILNSQSATFYVEDNWNFEENPILELDISFSDITKKNLSSLTFSLNGAPLKSMWFSNSTNNRFNETVITIPKELIKKGVNSISIEKFQNLTDTCYLDDTNPGNWIKINKGILNLKYSEDNRFITLKDFPLPFINKYPSTNKTSLKVFVNTNINSEEKLALATFSAVLGKLGKNFSGRVEVNKFDETLISQDNSIYISAFDAIPKKYQEYFSEEEKHSLNKGTGLKLIETINGKKLIIITSKQKIYDGLNSLFDTTTILQLEKVFIVLPNKNRNNLKEDSFGNEQKISLEQLGSSDITINGAKTNTSSIKVDFPKEKSIVNLQLELKYKFSDLVNNNDSTLKILVNGNSLWDNKLSKSKNQEEAIIDIPVEFIKNNSLFVEFQTNLIVGKNCNKSIVPWLTILKNSRILGTFKDKTTYTLEDFPAPFIKNHKFNNIGLSVSSDNNSLSFMASLFSNLGISLKYGGSLKYLTNSPEGVAIIIGNPQDNDLLKSIEKELVLPYKNGFKEFSSPKDFDLVGKNIYSVIQYFENKDTNRLIVFSDQNLYYENIIKNLNNLKGTGYISINENEGVYLEDEKISDSKTIGGEKFSRQYFGLIVLFIVSVIFLLLTFYLSRKKDL